MYIARQVPRTVGLFCRSEYATSINLLPSRYAAWARTYSNDASDLHFEGRPARMTGGYGKHKLYTRARRRFTTSPVVMHGHLTPPKPGEE